MADKSENKFSVGDKIVRTGGSANGIVDGGVYIVARCEVGRIWLVGHDEEYYSSYFELVEQKEKEMTFKNMKFDVAAIAKRLNVEHEEASRIIQEALFEQGYKPYPKGNRTHGHSLPWVFAYNDGDITTGSFLVDHRHAESLLCTIKPTYTIVEAEEQQEVVELNGKKYNKQELEKALSLLKPID